MSSGTITSTTNTFGDVPGTLSGSIGVPGPAGPGVPAGGASGQFLQKTSGVDYATDWVTVNLTGLATESWVTAGFYPLVGNPSGFVTSSALSPYALINSQAFTGTPSFPTGTTGVTQPTLTSTTQIATTAFVQQELAAGTANARNLEVLVRNQSGATMPAGSIVYISGATGNLPLVTLAQGNNDANSAQTMGFVKSPIANNGQGYVIVRGILENINTSALTEGVQLYLSPTTPGAWTTTKPVAPQHMVYVGIVIRSHPTLGTILVAVQNGYELDELHDVLITSPTNGQVLSYDSVSTLWKNTAVSAPVTSVAGKTGAVTLVVGDVSGAAPLASPSLSGNPTAPTPLTSDNDTSIATTAFVKAQGYLTSAPVTSVAGRTGAITLSTSDVSGLGTMATQTATDYLSKAGNLSGLADTSTSRSNLGLGTISTVNDAPSDGSTYGRQNGSWVVAGGGGGSVAWGGITGTLSDQLDLQNALDGKASLSGATFSGDVNTPTVYQNDSQPRVLNALSSEIFNGMNMADHVSLQISGFTYTFYGSSEEEPNPDNQNLSFSVCCPDGLNNLITFCANSGGSVVISGICPVGEINFPVTSFSSGTFLTKFDTMRAGQTYDFYVIIYYTFPYGSMISQKSRIKLFSATV